MIVQSSIRVPHKRFNITAYREYECRSDVEILRDASKFYDCQSMYEVAEGIYHIIGICSVDVCEKGGSGIRCT